MKYSILVSFFIHLCLATSGQNINYNISGYITDSESGETLANAHILSDSGRIGVYTNRSGFYSITLQVKTTNLLITMIGYEPLSVLVDLTNIGAYNFKLNPKVYHLSQVDVYAKKELIKTEELGSIYTLESKRIKEFPRLGGEVDILKVLQFLPGIKQGGEGSSGLHVRGGSPDQNLILLDGVPVYNAFHLFGFLSVFNSDAIKDINIYKSGIPARYEGRISSVVDISLKEGSLIRKSRKLSVSPVAGSFTIETPIISERSSLIIAGRRTWLDALFTLASNRDGSSLGYNFYDMSAKYQHKIGTKNNLFISFYSSQDKFYDKSKENSNNNENSFNWGNYTSLIRWNRQLSNKLFLNNSVYYSNYRFNQKNEYLNIQTQQSRDVRSDIEEINFNSSLDYFLASNNEIKIGLSLSHQLFQPELVIYKDDSIKLSNNIEQREIALVGNVFIDERISISDKLLLSTGLRLSIYNTGEVNYFNIQPRASLNYALIQGVTLKASYDRIAQNIHLLTNSTLGQPTDLWVPATEKVPVQISNQFSVGATKYWEGLGFEINIDGYIKSMNNVIEYKEGANYIYGIGESWQDKIAIGKGASRGIELLFKKELGVITGWFSYTLSKTTRQFEELNRGLEFPYKYDRTHDASLLMIYSLKAPKNKFRKLSSTFTYNTGNAITIPTATYQSVLPPDWQFLGSETIVERMKRHHYFKERNNFRMPAYHRLDLSYQASKLTKKQRLSTWTYSVYNVYNRLNPFYIYEKNGKLKQYSLFPIIPSISWSIEI